MTEEQKSRIIMEMNFLLDDYNNEVEEIAKTISLERYKAMRYTLKVLGYNVVEEKLKKVLTIK